MYARLTMPDYPWEQVEETKAFITRLFSGEAPDRPAAIVHPAPVDRPPAGPPAGLDDWQQQVWQAQQNLLRRPIGGDDFVPTLGTGAGTCAMATAFGCAESQVGGVYWVEPCITDMTAIDKLKKPPAPTNACRSGSWTSRAPSPRSSRCWGAVHFF